MIVALLQVQELPEGAERLASSDACPIAMYSIGSHVLCIQGRFGCAACRPGCKCTASHSALQTRLGSPPRNALSLWRQKWLVLCAAGHPEFNRDIVEAIVATHLSKHTMGRQDQTQAVDSYAQHDPQRDFALLQRLCTAHLRK